MICGHEFTLFAHGLSRFLGWGAGASHGPQLFGQAHGGDVGAAAKDNYCGDQKKRNNKR